MINIYHRTIKERGLKNLDHFRIGAFLYVESPSVEEIEELALKYNLDSAILKDALDPYEVPRLEVEEGTVYIFDRLPKKAGDQIATVPMLTVYHRDFIMVVGREPLPFIEKVVNGKNFYTTQKTKLLVQMLSEVNRAYNNFLIDISRQVRNLSVSMESIKNKDIVQFVNFESVINDFLSALVPANTMLTKLMSGKYFKLYEEDKDLIEDMYLSHNQLIVLCRANLKNIVNIRDAYSTIMTNNLNRILKMLAALTVVLTIPTTIGSFFGMNVAVPLDKNPHAFGFIVVGAILLSALALVVFIKNKWL